MKKMKQEWREKLIPLWMTGAVILVDQISKIIVAWAMNAGGSVGVFGDFFRITYQNNPYIIFGFGRDFPPLFQTIFFFILPFIGLGLLILFYVLDKSIRLVYRLPLAAIIGGGIGNLIDKTFRPDGVVDFLDFKVYGLFGLERWPTFNLADSAIVISVIVICIIAVVHIMNLRKNKKPDSV